MAESGTLAKVKGTEVIGDRRQIDIFDRVVRFISQVGFPIAVAGALIAYLWFIGAETNKHLARGSEVMNRAINVLERFERKLDK